eukprot:750406-Hanusia_phi.AAC.3
MDELMGWACEEGMPTPPLLPAYFETTRCRGLKATRAIQEGEIVLEVPYNLLMSADSAMECRFVREIVKAASQEEEQLCERQVLSLHLLIEKWKAELSRWWRSGRERTCAQLSFMSDLSPPSLAAMTRLRTGPRMNDTLVDPLQPFLAIAARRKRMVNDEFLQLQRVISRCKKRSWEEPDVTAEEENVQLGLSGFSLEDYLWAAGTVSTRSCHYERRSGYSLRGETVGCLVPVLDFLNHSTDPVAACGFSKDEAVYRVTCLRSYQPGEQVMIHYGDWSNAGLLEHYGFVLEDNPLDSCVLWLPHPPTPPDHCVSRPLYRSEFRRMQDVISSFGKVVVEENGKAAITTTTDHAVSWIEFELYAAGAGGQAELSWNLLTFLRWFAFVSSDMQDDTFYDKLLDADEASPISTANELTALQILEKTLREVQSALSTTDKDKQKNCSNEHIHIADMLREQTVRIIIKHMSWLDQRKRELEN